MDDTTIREESDRAVQDAVQPSDYILPPDNGSKETKIVLLGKTGTGKSSLGNTILGDSLFKAKMSATSVTSESQAESKMINGNLVTVIDTPGFFDTKMPEEELKKELIECLVECAPKLDAFLIVLQVGRFTEQENDVIDKILKMFSEKALKHSVVVFTHGYNLPKGKKIEDFVAESDSLTNLVKKCGGRCHVVDNEHWNQGDDYRSNKFQVAQLFNIIETIKTREGPYTSDLLELVEKEKATDGKNVVGRILTYVAAVSVGALLGAFFGGIGALLLKTNPIIGAGVGAAAGIGVGIGIAYSSDTPLEAARDTAKLVSDVGMKGVIIANSINNVPIGGQTAAAIVHNLPVS